jgi:ADP-ribose pyrophosphatase YjhB (NUDIX family)
MNKTVSAGGVVINKNGDVLVVSQQGTSWSLPKGHVNKGEDFLVAAKREVEEESGINDLQRVKELGSYERPGLDAPTEIKTIHMFLFKTDQMDLKPLDPENPEARWIKIDDVEKLLTAEKDKDFFRGIKNKL